MTAGKRRTAREMAVQMLYQSDLGGSPLPQIFRVFDLSEYLAREEASDKKRERAPGVEVDERLTAVPPSGPATPLTATATSARLKRSAPRAMALAVAIDTAPNVSINSLETPSASVLDSFE